VQKKNNFNNTHSKKKKNKPENIATTKQTTTFKKKKKKNDGNCSVCGQPGHFAAKCPDRKGARKTANMVIGETAAGTVGHTPRVLMQGRRKSRRRTPTRIPLYS
jgi:hypothetical protein